MTQTILVVDDQFNVRQLLQEYLTEQGFRVLTAPDGQVALNTVRHKQPDLILLDIMMPKMDGYQFLRQYRPHSKHQRERKATPCCRRRHIGLPDTIVP